MNCRRTVSYATASAFFCAMAITIVLTMPGKALAQGAITVDPEFSPAEETSTSERASPPSMQGLGGGLPAFVDLPPAAVAAADQLARLEERRAAGVLPLQIGFDRMITPPKNVDITLEDALGNAPGRPSEFIEVRDSTVVWSSRIRVANSLAFRIRLEDAELPRTAQIWVHDADGVYLGPFGPERIDANGNFWLPPLQSSEIFLEIQVALSELEDNQPFRFSLRRVAELVYGIEDVTEYGESSDPEVWTECSVDISCISSQLFDIDNIATGVARLVFQDDGGGSFLCSGALVNDTVPANFYPYLLTANHCFNSETEANSLVSYWNYRSSTCNGSPPSLSSVPQVTGADLLASSPTSDFTFVVLDKRPPGYRWYLGWTTTTPSDGQWLYSMSHPAGQKIHFDDFQFEATGGITCTGLPRPNFHYSWVGLGSTTGGSSGAPMWSSNGQIRGQLYGKCHFTNWDECSYNTYNRVDGAFAVTYPNISSWINNSNACTDDVYEPDDSCFGKFIAVGSSQQRRHCDVDWAYFNPQLNHTYRIETSGLTTDSDTTLALHLNCGGQVAFNDDFGGSLASRIDWTATSSASIDILIQQWNGYDPGDEYTLTVTDITQFATLTVTKSGTGNGTVTSNPAGINCGSDCSENYILNTVVQLSATANTGSDFIGWSGSCSGTSPTTTVTMNASKTCNARFDLEPRTLNVFKSGTGLGSVSSSPAGISCGSDCLQSYAYGTVVTLTATPNTGSFFVGWSGSCSGTSATTTVTMNANKTCNAQFNIIYYPLTVSKTGTGAGTVTSNPAGISCGTDCAESYAYNTFVTLTATPNTGSYFVGWSGACSGTNPTATVTMTAARSCNAQFNILAYNLTITKSGTGTGTVTSSPAGIDCGGDCSQSYNYGTLVTLTAIPSPNNVFVGWSGACSGASPSTTVSMTSARTCNAQFDVGANVLTVTKSGTGEGFVSSSPAGISCGSDCSEAFTAGTVVTLTATPNTGSTFTGWSGACSGSSATTTVTMDVSKTCNAQFSVIFHTLTITKSGTGSGTVTGSGINCGGDCNESFAYGTVVTLTATANAGSTFAGWSGACSGSAATTSVTMNANKTCNAAFASDISDYQQIYADPSTVGAQPGGPARIDVKYNVSTGDASLTGIGIRAHYDSSKLSFDSVSNTLANGRLFDPTLVTDELDSSNFDSDATTDRFISMAWVDFSGNWPGSLPESLASVHFTTAPGFGSSQVKFSASDLAAGYGLDAMPATVVEQQCTLDVDDNGDAGALTDGVLIVRYLFGFTGAQLTDGAIGSGAARTQPADIIDYLNGCPTMLDPDGNGSAGALTDGVLIVRYLFGFTCPQLGADAIGPGATRTCQEIIIFLNGYTPTSTPVRKPVGAAPDPITAHQMVSGRVERLPSNRDGRIYKVHVDYTTAEPFNTGLGLRMHFDSSLLTLAEVTEVFAAGELQYQVQDDALDFDGDPATDKFLIVAWMDPWGAWPGTYEEQLFTASFHMDKRQASAKTTIRYSIADVAADTDVYVESVEIGPGNSK